MTVSLESIPDGTPLGRDLRKLAQAANPVVPQARVFNSANITLANNTATALTFDSERFDNGSLHSTSSNTSRLTVPITGLYHVGGQVQWAASAAGQRGLRLRLNGSTLLTLDARMALTDGNETHQSVSTPCQLVAGDYVELLAIQLSGGNLNVSFVANYSPDFWMYRVAGYMNAGV